MSVTAYQDGPALSDQGTIVAAQVACKPQMLHVSALNVGGTNTVACPRIAQYHNDDLPNYSTMQAMPNAYFNNSKHGCYLPLIMTKTTQQWNSAADSHWTTDALATDPAMTFTTLTSSGGAATWPFYDVTRAYHTVGVSTMRGELTPALCNDVLGHIATSNLSVNTSFTFYIRQGWEIQCTPTSSLSALLGVSPAYDSAALKAYFIIRREMKDAYPADHNDLGKIWDVIKKVVIAASPALRLIPGIGPILPTVARGAILAGDALGALVKRTSSARTGSTVSAADVARVRKAAVKKKGK
jgi:hypothetical protein